VELQQVGTRGIARHPSTKQEQPTPKRGRLALIEVDIKNWRFPSTKIKS